MPAAKKRSPAEPRLSRLRPPADLPPAQWQATLRRQFGREQNFGLQNLGHEPVFSEFLVSNPQTQGRYRVTVRGAQPGDNRCTCVDYATNDLGTCKHIEFTLARLQARRGGKAALKKGFEPLYSEVFLHNSGQRSVRFRVGAACPHEVAQRAARLFDGPGGALAEPRFAELQPFIDFVCRQQHELRCTDEALAFIADWRDARARERVLGLAYPDGAGSPALAKLLKIGMYPYQAEGALFAARAGRCLLGDEMGLGKTVQAIAAAELMARHFGVQRVLVVCPTSLKHQWQREILRFAGREAQVIQGLRAARQAGYAEEAFCKITHYETLARDADLIQAWSPELVIVDEAQRIKNWNTIAARALKRIDSPYAVVLTGTPLENRLEELISIVQFVDQHRLGPTWRLLHEHQQRDETGRVVGYRNLGQIGATLAPVMLRRRKAEVLAQLPPRVDHTRFVPMTAQQRTHHDENGDIVARIVKRWRKTGFLSDADQRRLTCALQNMRMSCNSTFLLDHETDFGHKADELLLVLDDLFTQPDAKVVVFSQWLRTHELIERRLRTRGWGHVLFHGGVAGEKRGALVDRFRNDPACRVFLSTDAGGVGLNLQHAAASVVNMDLPWNPAVLEQRIGRVHRIGQTRGVQVLNFVAQGTIEEGMLQVLAFKKSLFAGVLDGGETEVFMQGTRLSKFMKSVEEVTGTMGQAEVLDEVPAASEEATPEATLEATPEATPETSPPAADPWAPLLDAGLSLLQQLAAPRNGAGAGAAPAWIETDASGRTFLKLPVPEAATLQRLAAALGSLLKARHG